MRKERLMLYLALWMFVTGVLATIAFFGMLRHSERLDIQDEINRSVARRLAALEGGR